MNEAITAHLSGAPPVAAQLAERLETLGRELRASFETISGCAVLLHPASGHAFAAGYGADTIVVRLDSHPGFAAAPSVELPDGWVAIEAWPQDALFRRGNDLVRDALARGFAAAE